jgi:mono/diheme cytochrome c family protein
MLWLIPWIRSRQRASTAALALGLEVVLAVAAWAQADDFAYGRRLFLEKAQCQYCHGWAGDGAGEPQSNGGAANLRESKLTREQLVEVILCGRPTTPMPRFDEDAYTDDRCYGMTEKDLGAQVPSLPPGGTLRKREAEAVADYLIGKVIGRGAVTRQECEEAFGAGARACTAYAGKQ